MMGGGREGGWMDGMDGMDGVDGIDVSILLVDYQMAVSRPSETPCYVLFHTLTAGNAWMLGREVPWIF